MGHARTVLSRGCRYQVKRPVAYICYDATATPWQVVKEWHNVIQTNYNQRC